MRRILTVLVVALAAPASAHAGWSAPQRVSDGGSADAVVALPGGGARLALGDAEAKIGAVLRNAAPGGAFGPGRTLLAEAEHPYRLRFTGDGGGVVLAQGRGGTRAIPFDATGRLGAPLAVGRSRDVDTAASPAGALVVAWLHEAGQATEVLAAVREPGAASFGAPMRAGFALDPDSLVRAGVSDRGEAVVTWQVNRFPSTAAAAVRLPAAAAFARPHIVSRRAVNSELAVAGDGSAVLAFNDERHLQVSLKAAGAATVPAVRTLDRDTGSAFAGDVVPAAAGGRLGLIWTASAGRRATDGAAVRVFLGSARGLRRVARLGRASGFPQTAGFAIDARGDAVATWQVDVGRRARLAAAFRPAGGRTRFGATTLLGRLADSVSTEALVATPGGALAAWEAFASGDGNARGFREVYVSRFTR